MSSGPILDDFLKDLNQIKRRLTALESINHSAVLKFGNITIDNENNRILIADNTGNTKINIDGANQRVLIYDASNPRTLLDGQDGALKISKSGYSVLTATAAQMLFDSDQLLIALGNVAYTIHPGPRQWTENNYYTTINSTEFELDGDDLTFLNVYFEILGCVEQSPRIAYYRIYNITDGAALANSEVSTNAVSSEAEGWINAAIITSSALTFPSGTKKYRLQFKQDQTGGAGNTPQFFKGSLVFRPT